MAEGGTNMQSSNNIPEQFQQSQQIDLSAGETELATKTIHIQSKRFYLDVKQNRRGRFIKIAEVSAGGRKSRILMSMNVASELRDHLDTFHQQTLALGEHNSNNQQIPSDDGRLHSAVITRDDRKYYLDLKENERGRFLRISMVGIHNPRTQIALPAQGIEELRDTLTGLLNEFGNEDDKDSIESLPPIEPEKLPENKFLHVGNKNFYFDIGSNNRGVFLRISEVRGNLRTAVTVPEKCWSRVRDYINEFITGMEMERQLASSSENISHLSPSNEDRSSAPQSSFGENKI